MSNKISAGLLMYRFKQGQLEVFLAHPGGPYYAGKDAGAWTIPKGETDTAEELLAALRADFAGHDDLRRYLLNMPKFGQEHCGAAHLS